MTDNKDVLGSLFEDDEPEKESPSIEIAEDGMEAYLLVPPQPMIMDIRELIGELGISFGVDSELVADINEKLLDGAKTERKYLLAKGKKPVFGQPGELILRTQKPEDMILSSEDLTQVDYKVYKKKMLALAEKEKPIAMVIEPTKGHSGMNIFGEAIEGKDGDEVVIDMGEHVYRSGKKIISKIDGLIEYRKNADGTIYFDVSEVYIVEGDVDYSTGNISFTGSVIVKGTVKAGFEVDARNEVVAETIRGTVKSGGAVVAKKGIIGGTKKAQIYAGGAVYAKFIQNAEIHSGESVEVKKSIIMSEVYAEKEVNVETSPGSIIGGSTYAVEGVNVKVLGSESFVKTEVALYQSVSDVVLLRDIISQRFELSKNLLRIDTYLGQDRKMLFNGVAGDKKELVNKLLKKRDQLRRELLEKNGELKSIQRMLTTPVNGRIVVEKTVWPEVRISIAGKYMLLKNEKKKGSFYFDKENERVEFK